MHPKLATSDAICNTTLTISSSNISMDRGEAQGRLTRAAARSLTAAEYQSPALELTLGHCLMSDIEPLSQDSHLQAESLTAEPTPNAQSLDAATVNAQDSSEQHASKFQRVEVEETRNTYLERDPGLRHQIGTYSVNQRDDIRREYIKMGPYQPKLRDYPLTNDGMQERRLRLKTSKQACAFRGHDESVNSRNRGNFIELIKHSAECSKEIAQVVLENAPSYAKYTSSDIQKELLNILANKVRNKIRRELGDGKFCILVDEALDESDKEQMAIILRYVDCDGYIRERFFEVVNVMETIAVTLKKEICNVLARYDLLVENIRGQGYDGASNMRGAWNGLQALFLKDCPYAYYIHCFAHQLQLALVAASNDVPDVWLFFSALGSIVNVLTSSAKRLSELKSVWEAEIIDLIASGEVQTGTGANQIHTLQRPGATRWSSHFRSVSRLLDLFSVVRKVFGKLVECGRNNNIRGEAKDMPDMKARHMKGRGRSCQQNDYITVEHYYHYDIFNTVIDFQLMELNNRFTEQTLELLTLSSALNPIDAFKSFKIEDICSLAERFYPEDFTKIELQALRRQLECFEIDIHSLQEFQNITSLSELCRRLVETRKSQIYFLLDRLIRLVLTLPVSTATTERAFSAMKLIKTTHRNKMENEFLSDCMVIYIEREIEDNIDSDAIADEFSFLKNRRTQLRQ
ncbi:TTF-type domain-containing protein [Citrus sinensis]|nr:TTF-type domain-containing protein [Citrus sinensis]